MGQVTVGGKKVQFSIGDILKAMTVLGSIFPAITGFIKSLEGNDIPGADKKNAALAFIEALLKGAGAYFGEITDDVIAIALSFADHLIDAIVAAYNKVSIFVHKPKV